MSLAAIFTLLIRQEEANAAAKSVLETEPRFSLGRASKASPYNHQADIKLVADALRKTGLPE
jgi:hypothetical protein